MTIKTITALDIQIMSEGQKEIFFEGVRQGLTQGGERAIKVLSKLTEKADMFESEVLLEAMDKIRNGYK